jgi:hypothetical protein
MGAYPILQQDPFTHPNLPGAEKWQSAFTYKMVGALRGITKDQPHVLTALKLGIGLGLLIEISRKLLKSRRRYQRFANNSRAGRATGFLLDAVFLPSPYAYAFGGFVEFITVVWWAAGGVVASLFEAIQARLSARKPWPTESELPADMSTMSLAGGGLIAGDALASLAIGVYGLLKAML